MTRRTYAREGLGKEIEAPVGYYQPLEERSLYLEGRRVLYTKGIGCIEASCCGVGSWAYIRVEGYVIGQRPGSAEKGKEELDVDTVESDAEKQAISTLLIQEYPDARIEFR